jgi:flagellar hook assembly protein FlgD
VVRTLVNEKVAAGTHQVTWDGRNDLGAQVGSGIYFYRLTADQKTSVRKMVLMR